MPNNISPELLKQLYAQESEDPLILLLTLTHPTFSPIYLANNTEDIVSNGTSFAAFPMKIRLSADDGETQKEVSIDFDNVGLDLIDEIRTVVTPISVKIDMILASDPDSIQMTIDDLKMRSVTYNSTRISAKLYYDSFLNVELTSEKYTPSTFPGLF
jgi:hypothetical protein